MSVTPEQTFAEQPAGNHIQPSTQNDIALAYEQYKKEMTKLESLAQRGEAGPLVLERIKELKKLFNSVKNSDVKELSMFMNDSEALLKTTVFASTNASNMDFGDLGGTLPVEDFLQAARRYMNPDLGNDPVGLSADEMHDRFNSLDWGKLGALFYLKGKTPVVSHFLYGPLATKRRRIGPRTRRVDDTKSNIAKTTAQKVSASDLQDDPEQNTTHMVRAVFGVLKKKDADTKVNLYKFFVNPHSFAQTVENLFYTSFLVRDGKFKVTMGPDNIPYVEQVSDEPAEDETSLMTHHIALLDGPAWRALIDNFNITESYIPHRTTAEQSESDSSDESDGGDQS
ncbi:Binding domain of Nse4/EID3 to Nse3-MAGE [Metschnikowia aff. pulcherrima]|uniref:Non-structural maintenance of chromosomes element 4 n=1 Tax=Metschnikowia aff. pulcherrima TaxID=2163413 RepID=A0A4P6XFH7_9ASCO|nr:Binding domain of Nse4/EID3 to Nse3-MAGE [Metschnikowia aff. pulcherrima]